MTKRYESCRAAARGSVTGTSLAAVLQQPEVPVACKFRQLELVAVNYPNLSRVYASHAADVLSQHILGYPKETETHAWISESQDHPVRVRIQVTSSCPWGPGPGHRVVCVSILKGIQTAAVGKDSWKSESKTVVQRGHALCVRQMMSRQAPWGRCGR